MANVRVEEKSPGRFTRVWMVLALVMTVALLIWLAIASEPTDLQVVEETSGDAAASVAAVPVSEFAADPARFTGQEIRLEGLAVTDVMDAQAFWTRPGGGTPYLIRLDPLLVEEGRVVEAGQTVNVVGVVHMLTDSVVAAWEAAGVIESPAERAEVQFATSFLEAVAVQPAESVGAEGGGGTAADPGESAGR